jgi:serine/threonine-protein kinase
MQILARAPSKTPLIAGRYAIYDEIAAGGTATVHLGRLVGPEGFSRTVAIKRLHSQLAKDPAFTSMFLDEARLASRIRQANVVPILDVHSSAGELLLVMDFVQGESLARLCAEARSRGEDVPLEIVSAITTGMLAGLHSAHEARSESGELLHLVHRDVSPQNVLVGADGVARLIDFGIAKARGRAQVTREGQLKGKLAYMAPEQILGQAVDRRTDIYSASIVLWLVLTGQLPFEHDDARVVYQILHDEVPPPSELSPQVPAALDELVLRGLSREPERRFATALEMAEALERIVTPATAREVGAWVERIAGGTLRSRAECVARIEAEASPPFLEPVVSIGERGAYRGDESTAAAVSSIRQESNRTGRPRTLQTATGLVAAIGLAAAAGAFVARSAPTTLVSARTGVVDSVERLAAEVAREPAAPATAETDGRAAAPIAEAPAGSARVPSPTNAAPRSPRGNTASKRTLPPEPDAPAAPKPDPKYGF